MYGTGFTQQSLQRWFFRKPKLNYKNISEFTNSVWADIEETSEQVEQKISLMSPDGQAEENDDIEYAALKEEHVALINQVRRVNMLVNDILE